MDEASHYDDAFYEGLEAGSLSSARVTLGILWEHWTPKSVVDVGCGRGAWLKAALELGAEDALGIDGAYAGRDGLLIEESRFRSADLSERVTAGRRFDLAVSLEVAEHLPAARAESFVADLAELSDFVLFSAALPYQGGVRHVNEQWLEYWGILFRKHGYQPFDLFRERIWGDRRVEIWYRQNVILFCRNGEACKIFPEAAAAGSRPLSIPHPLLFLVNVARYRPLASQALKREAADYLTLLDAYLRGETAIPPLALRDATGMVDGAEVPLFPEARTRTADVLAGVAWYEMTLKAMSESLDAQKRDVETAAAKLRESEERAGSLSTKLAIREGEARTLSRWKAEWEKEQGEIERLHAELRRADHELRELRGSLSWRVTGPLRRACGLLPVAGEFLRSRRKGAPPGAGERRPGGGADKH